MDYSSLETEDACFVFFLFAPGTARNRRSGSPPPWRRTVAQLDQWRHLVAAQRGELAGDPDVRDQRGRSGGEAEVTVELRNVVNDDKHGAYNRRATLEVVLKNTNTLF